MVMEESAMHHHHQPHSPSGGDTPNNNSNTTNVYLVGLEFVRQYYTVLNQGPLYLHRFYSDDSSFVHGVSARDSKVAYGQQEIHKRIQSLNFHNCHAKIRQVDSHETLGNGVVIQVTGELSNNGQPMRRFMQTFVLAPQTPKRYYVRNDIFHYQDEVFCDDENDQETAAELDTEEAEENERESIVDVTVNGELPIEPTTPIMSAPVEVSAKLSPTNISSRPSPKVEEEEEEKVVPEPVPVTTIRGPVVESVVISTVTATPVNSAPAPVEEEPAPKTYANLFKNSGFNNNKAPPPAKFQSAPPNQTSGAKGPNGPSGASPNNSQFSVNTGDARTTSPSQVSPQPSGTSAVKGLPPRNPRGQQGYGKDRQSENNRPPMDRDVKERRERLTSRSSTTLNDETGSIDGDRRRPVHTYPDSHQLFVGNLPHFVTVQDMKDIFSEFGEVAEVKIQKPTPKSGGMKVPYFCFVVFEEAVSAQKAIDRKGEIFMKIPGGGNRRLNVEQKRSQRSGRPEGDHSDAPYNRMDAASPGGGGPGGNSGGGGGGRPSEGNRNNSRTFRGSNRGGDQDRRGGGGDRNDRDRGGDRGGNMGRGGGGMNHGGGGRGGGGGGGMRGGQGGNKP